jgi:hypothetical protein
MSQEVPLSKIIFEEKHKRRKKSKYFRHLMKDILDNGLKYPIILYSDYTLREGWSRYMVFKELGRETIPAVFIT